MQKTLLKTIISRQNDQRKALVDLPYVERTKTKKGREWMASDLVKVVLGPRRAGKSVFSLMLLKEKTFAYFNFDDPALLGEKLDLYELMDELKSFYGNTKYVLFDEIQNLPGWELFANRLHREGYNLVLTGSNAKLLSMELATHLTGRHYPIEILPFDFKEFLRAKNYELKPGSELVGSQRSKMFELLELYMTKGGFPEVVLKQQQPRGYLDALFNAVLFKDVVKRHKVRFAEQIDQLGSYLLNNVAGLYSSRKLANLLKFKSDVTLERYLNYLNEAYLVFSLSGFSTKAGERLRSAKKTYVVDNGFVDAVAVQQSANSGKLMENLVFTELVKQGHEPNKDFFYYKTRNNKEVDFAIKVGWKIEELVQVCYDVSSPGTEEREVKALVEAAEELKVKKLTVLTWDDKKEIKNSGKTIHFKPLWEWLTEPVKK